MSNVLSHEKRLEVLAALVNGAGPSAASRMTGVHRDTIGRFGFAVGLGCERLHDRLVRDLSCAFVDMDEQHSWCAKRQVHVDPERDDMSKVGERWTWAAICRTSRLIIAWHLGKRDAESADALVGDVRARLSVMPQVTTDGCALYVEPVARHFGYGVDMAQMIKRFSNGGGKPGVAEKFSVASGVQFIEKRTIFGAPDLAKTTTYAIERSNLTNRLWNARLHRRTLCFSKRTDRHDASIALAYVFRNLCHIPKNMRETAAMAAGVTDRLWSLEELMVAALAEPAGEKPEAQPLTFRTPTTTARALPGDRGFLRAVPSGAVAPPTRHPAAPPPAAAAAPPAAPPSVPKPDATADPRQLDLLSWRPRPAKPMPSPGSQLSLFDRE